MSNKNSVKKQSIVEIRSISKSKQDKILLKNINIDVLNQQNIGIICSSSESLQCLAEILVGNMIFDSGELFVDGLNIKKSRSLIKKQIALVSELNPMIDSLTIRDNLSQYLEIFDLNTKNTESIISQLLREHLLEGLQDNFIDDLELHQQLAFYLLRAQLSNPKVIVLDLSGAQWSELTSRELSKICSEYVPSKQTLILLTKKIDHIDETVNHIVIINEASQVCAGEAKVLLKDTVGERVAITQVSPDDIEYYLKKIRNNYHYHVLNNKIRIYLKGDVEDTELLNVLNSEHIEIRKANLSDMYFRMTEVEMGN